MGKAKIYGMKQKVIRNRNADRLRGKAMAHGWAKPTPPNYGRGDGKSMTHLKEFAEQMERYT